VVFSAGDLRRAHAEIGHTEQVIDQRRVLYSTVLDIVTDADTATDHPVDLLDSPALRGNLGEVLNGTGGYRPGVCVPLDALAAPGFTTAVAGIPVRLASSRSAGEALEGARRRVNDELHRHGDDAALALLLDAEDPATVAAFGHLVDGLRLAIDVAPDLALDLLPHVSLFAVLTIDSAARLGSASAREFPGMILIPEPETPIEVAEALVHEGAHQKFFDFATTRTLFGSTEGMQFTPSWAPVTAPAWPIEQTFAAWHAYCCLSAFAHALPGDSALPAHSLLDKADVRATELGSWLLDNGKALGPDGHALLFQLLGRAPTDPSPHEETPLTALGYTPDGPEWIERKAGDRTLLARRTTPPELYWAPSASAL
jgi:hypothetical protein